MSDLPESIEITFEPHKPGGVAMFNTGVMKQDGNMVADVISLYFYCRQSGWPILAVQQEDGVHQYSMRSARLVIEPEEHNVQGHDILDESFKGEVR